MVPDVKTKFLAPVNALINEINESASEDGDGDGEGIGVGAPSITCIVSDPMMIFSIEFGIPLLLFFVFSASTLLLYSGTRSKWRPTFKSGTADENGYLDPVIERMTEGIDGIMRLKDLPTFFRLTDPNFSPYLKFMELFEKSLDKNLTTGVILNTTEELEPIAVRELSSIFPKLFTIGPLHRLADEMPNDDDLHHHHHLLDSFKTGASGRIRLGTCG